MKKSILVLALLLFSIQIKAEEQKLITQQMVTNGSFFITNYENQVYNGESYLFISNANVLTVDFDSIKKCDRKGKFKLNLNRYSKDKLYIEEFCVTDMYKDTFDLLFTKKLFKENDKKHIAIEEIAIYEPKIFDINSAYICHNNLAYLLIKRKLLTEKEYNRILDDCKLVYKGSEVQFLVDINRSVLNMLVAKNKITAMESNTIMGK